ncbi:APC family permease [soil metagenome]
MKGLKKELNLFEVTLYGVGIILGAGIYALIGQGAGLTGNSLWLSFVIGAVVASFTGLSYAELATIFPRAAAEYLYVTKAFGSRLLAFLIGWLHLLTATATVAVVSLGFSGYLSALLGTPILLTAIILISILSFINYLGIKQSSRVNVLFTLIEISGLILIILLSLTNVRHVISINYFQMNNGTQGLLAAAALVFFAYIGFEDIANVAEETKNAKRVLAKAFILAVAITTVLYILTAVAAVSLVSPDALNASKSPLALAASKSFLGNNAFVLLSIIALFATSNTVLVAMIVSSRMMYGMSRDKALPSFLSRLDVRRGTPIFSIAIFMVFAFAFLFMGGISFIANMTSLTAFLTFALVNACLILLRYKSPSIHRPFKTPINIGKFPVLAFLGLISSIFMAFQFKIEVVLFTVGVAFIGVLVFTINNKFQAKH